MNPPEAQPRCGRRISARWSPDVGPAVRRTQGRNFGPSLTNRNASTSASTALMTPLATVVRPVRTPVAIWPALCWSRSDGRLHVPADLARAEVERRPLQPALDLLDAADGALRDLRRLTRPPTARSSATTPPNAASPRISTSAVASAPGTRRRRSHVTGGLDDRRDDEPEEHREHDVPQLDRGSVRRPSARRRRSGSAGSSGRSRRVPRRSGGRGSGRPPVRCPGRRGPRPWSRVCQRWESSGGRVRACAGARRDPDVTPDRGRGSGHTRAPLPRWERGPGGSRSSVSPSPSAGPRRSRRGSPGC